MFDPARMEARHRLISEVLIPSLRSQCDPDFVLALLITDNLPAGDEARLRAAIADLPQARIVKLPTAQQLRFGCRRAIKLLLDPEARKWATFRIDDDDALARDYVAQLRAHTVAATEPKALSFTRGVEIALTRSGELVARRDNRPASSAGLALLSQAEAVAFNERFPSVYQLGPHRKVADHVTLDTDAASPMYVRLLHDGNVSSSTIRNVAEVSPARLNAVLRRRFPGLPRETLKNLASDPVIEPIGRLSAE